MFRNKNDFQKICKILGYEFKNTNLLLQALTRRSALVEGRQSREIDDFQRLEFIGDKILNLVISDTLMAFYPTWREGQLTQETAKYVNNKGPLVAVARRLQLNDFLIMGRGEEMNNQARENNKVLSDAMEALLGALWLDSNRNYDLLKKFVLEYWGPLGLMPAEQYQDLTKIIFDYEMPKLKRIKQFQAVFNKGVDVKTLEEIVESTMDEADLLEIVLTKPIKETRLTEILVKCAQAGWAMQVSMLLKKGADATAMCGEETLLQNVVTSHFEESSQIVELLLQHNANPNWQRGKVKEIHFKNSVRSYAQLLAYFRDKSSVETITREYEDTNTALHRVMFDDNVTDPKRQLQITKSLLKHGANPNLKNEDQKIPLHIIAENLIQTEAYVDIIDALVAAKSNVNSQDTQGNTPLHRLLISYREFMVCDFKIIEAIKLLLTVDFNIDTQNNDKNTVLHLAYLWFIKHKPTPQVVYMGMDVIELILTKKPNKQLKNAKGLTSEYFEQTIRIDEQIVIEMGLQDPLEKITDEKDEKGERRTFAPF